MSTLGLLRQLPVVVNWEEAIFECEYLCKYNVKIEKIYTLVCGPQDVLLGIKTLKIGSLDCPFKLILLLYLLFVTLFFSLKHTVLSI